MTKYYAIYRGRNVGVTQSIQVFNINTKKFSNSKGKVFNKESKAVNYLINQGLDIVRDLDENKVLWKRKNKKKIKGKKREDESIDIDKLYKTINENNKYLRTLANNLKKEEQTKRKNIHIDDFSFFNLRDFRQLCNPKKEKESYKIPLEEDKLIAYVDGSYLSDMKAYGYGVVLFSGFNKYTMAGFGRNKDIIPLRNVAGEFLATMMSVEFAIMNKYKEICIFYDYVGIEKFAKNETISCKLPILYYQSYMNNAKNKLDINFIKVNSSEDFYHNEADRLAYNAIVDDSLFFDFKEDEILEVYV